MGNRRSSRCDGSFFFYFTNVTMIRLKLRLNFNFKFFNQTNNATLMGSIRQQEKLNADWLNAKNEDTILHA